MENSISSLVDGTYFINRLFATIEFIPKTIINIGEVGVVNSYHGEKGIDVSGEEYKHGELVEDGCKGIWRHAMAPGKYALNTYATKIVKVPTTNVILKWISGQIGGHKLDENLKRRPRCWVVIRCARGSSPRPSGRAPTRTPSCGRPGTGPR